VPFDDPSIGDLEPFSLKNWQKIGKKWQKMAKMAQMAQMAKNGKKWQKIAKNCQNGKKIGVFDSNQS
jgi:hypothetical protein